MKKDCCCCLYKIPFVLGFLSIIGSIAIWFLEKGGSAEAIAHAERFGIFVGLWAPTFFGISACLFLFRNCKKIDSSEVSCCNK